MTSTVAIGDAHVRFFAGKQDTFVQSDSEWHRLTPKDAARSHTGYDRETHEPSVGIYIVRRPNGLLEIGFDIFRLNVNLRSPAIEHLAHRWRQESATLSKSLLRSVERRVHFSKSFAQFEVLPERLEEWQAALSAVLSNSESYQPI